MTSMLLIVYIHRELTVTVVRVILPQALTISEVIRQIVPHLIWRPSVFLHFV